MEMQEDEVIILASYSAHVRFRDSAVWTDFCNDLNQQLVELERLYDECTDLRQLGDIQGARKAIRQMLSLPDRFIDALREGMKPEELEDSDVVDE